MEFLAEYEALLRENWHSAIGFWALELLKNKGCAGEIVSSDRVEENNI